MNNSFYEDNLRPSVSIEINSKAQELRSQGNKIINMSIGQPSFPLPDILKGYLVESVNNNFSYYTASQGLESLRNRILEWHEIHEKYDRRNVIVTPGAKYAIYCTLKTILKAGDEVILFSPYWLSYIDIIYLCHAKPIIVKTDEDFSINLDNLKEKINKNTKAVIINNPNNPSGKILDIQLMEDLYDITSNFSAFLIADEIYSAISYKKRFVSFSTIFDLNKTNIVVIDGVSKSLSCTGLRIGYLIAQEKLINKILTIHQHIATCAGSIEQAALSMLTKEEYRKITHDFNFEYSKVKDQILQEQRIRKIAHIPDGTFYMLIDITKRFANSYDASKVLLENYGIATVPGEVYGVDNCIRISFAGNIDDIEDFITIVKEGKVI